MAYEMTHSDAQVVYNLRHKFKDRIKTHSDSDIAESWREFSGSEDYPDEEKYLDWLAMVAEQNKET
jgi:hypothetical protein